MKIKRLHQIFLPVTDTERSSKWYKDHFSLSERRLTDSLRKNAVELSFGHTGFIIYESEQLSKYTHIPFNFHTDAIRELHDDLKRKGEVVTALTEDDGMLCCDFYDPDGNRIGLVFESGKDQTKRHMEVGGTFLAVQNLERAVEWYLQKLGYEFHYFSATGAAGYVGPTPEYIPDLTVRYAGFNHDRFDPPWSRMCLVETPGFTPLNHIPYNLYSTDAEYDYMILQNKEISLSVLEKGGDHIRFHFIDIDGNQIEVIQEAE